MQLKHSPNPDNASIEEIELCMESSADRKMPTRLQAIRLLLLGYPVDQVAEITMRSLQSIRNYVHRFNQDGIDGLATAPRLGRPRKLSKDDVVLLSQYLEDPESHNESQWTLLKLWGRFKEEYAKSIGYSTFCRNLREQGYRFLIPRPEAPERDPELREAFAKALSDELSKPDQQVWFMDEAGFLADPRPKRQIAPKGTTPVCPKTGLHIRESLIGAVCPETGEATMLMFNRVNTEVFQCFLDDLKDATSDKTLVLVLDNASWHKSKALDWGNIRPLFLPPYSPDMNPIERLWKYIKDNWFANWYTKDRLLLQSRLIEAVEAILEMPDRVQSVCRV